jgi:uncharacterized protein (DUF305 family)
MKKIMRTSIYISILSLMLYACRKDETKFTSSNDTASVHDMNEMIVVIHKMMNQMDTMDLSGDPDHHFAKMMIMHHKGGIEMSNIARSKGRDTTVNRIAKRIIEKQGKDITELNAFLVAHPSNQNQSPSFNSKVKISMEKMHRNADLQYINGNTDHDFAIIMIVHHQSAIEMADLILAAGVDTTIANRAKMMKDDQELEIEQLQKWLLK